MSDWNIKLRDTDFVVFETDHVRVICDGYSAYSWDWLEGDAAIGDLALQVGSLCNEIQQAKERIAELEQEVSEQKRKKEKARVDTLREVAKREPQLKHDTVLELIKTYKLYPSEYTSESSDVLFVDWLENYAKSIKQEGE